MLLDENAPIIAGVLISLALFSVTTGYMYVKSKTDVWKVCWLFVFSSMIITFFMAAIYFAGELAIPWMKEIFMAFFFLFIWLYILSIYFVVLSFYKILAEKSMGVISGKKK